MDELRVTGVPELAAALGVTEDRILTAVGQAIRKAGLAVERQAKLNADTGSHRRGTPRIQGSGPGPNVVSGDLRRSIRTEMRSGFGVYVAEVSASMVYARAVELGLPRWGHGYPYLGPAVEANRGTMQTIFNRALAAAITRG